MRSFEDRGEKNGGLVFPRPCQRCIEMNRRRRPALRDDSGNGQPGPMLAMHRWQQEAVFRRYAGPAFVLQYPATQDLLDEGAVVDECRAGFVGLSVESNLVLSLDHELAVT